MQAKAISRYVKLSPQKCRLVANQVRRLPVEKALELLNFSPRKGARLVRKTLDSAIANAENNEGLDIDELWINEIMVDEAPLMKRYRARAKGRGSQILKRSCHITVSVCDDPQPKRR